MPDYHVGTVDEEGIALLSGSDHVQPVDEPPRPVFLDPKVWRKVTLHAKTVVSSDTRIFTFKLDFDEQELGLPTGQHLMMRLRDPASREAIIRSYTPLSETKKRGYLDVLVKIYFDTKDKKGGRMTQALEAIPIGHSIDFKGPIGKFEYLGGGTIALNGAPRQVSTFYMICGGSGITPIFQVLRAIMQDKKDPTRCVVIDGNRLLEDILCKSELDAFAAGNTNRCKLLYTLTQPPTNWTGLRGRVATPLLLEHANRAAHSDGEAMALICGPGPFEKAVHKALQEIGWHDDELMFF